MSESDSPSQPAGPSLTKRLLIWGIIIGLFWTFRQFYPAMQSPNADANTVSRVFDQAQIISDDQRHTIDLHHKQLLLNHDIDYVIHTAKATGSIESYSVEQFEKLKVGEKSRTGRGLLLVVDPQQDELRMEVSESLEGVFVDAFVAYIEQRQMVPFFQENRIADGIQATSEMIVTRAMRAEENAGFDSEAWAPRTLGGGASAQADIGTGYTARDTSQGDVKAAEDPVKTVFSYIEAMQNRNASPDLSIYTAATREMLRSWVVTPAQMDNVVSAYRQCPVAQLRLENNRAVFRYPIQQRQCSPWFLALEDGAWRLDLTMMQKSIRFNTRNEWRFLQPETHPYEFAFSDWMRDQNGFPQLVE